MSLLYEFDFRPVLKYGGKSLMGLGRAKLLREIRETNSLSKAAKKMGMSYRHAWGIVNRMEEICGESLIKSERGGSERGTSHLTESGERLLAEFEGKYSALERAYSNSIKKPSLTADGILVSDAKIVLVKRKNEPFKGRYAIPGGFVEYGETVENCVVREFIEETGLRTSIDRLLGVYSDPGRDPRGHTVTVAFVLTLQGGSLTDSDETHAEWVKLNELPKLAFDHSLILKDYMRSVKKKR